jgi:uncharacterized delta-60 repeat protein
MKSRWVQGSKSGGCLITLSLFSAILFLLFLILGSPHTAQAAPGDLDPSFGSGGIVTTTIGTDDADANAVAIQSDGKVVAGGFFLNDTLSQNEFALVRYTTTGVRDTTFGTGGIVRTPIGTDDEVNALAIQSDGKVVAAGTSFNEGQNEFALVRYTTTGALDTTFNPTGTMPGIVTTAIGTDDDEAYALAIQPDGKLVVAGYSNNGSQDVFALVRYNADGSLDTTFNPTGTMPGIVTTAIGTGDEAFALDIDLNGNLVAGGTSFNGNLGQNEFALVRYTTTGALDTTFGLGGIVTTALGTHYDQINSLAIDSNGNLVAAGYSDKGNQYVFTLVRYTTTGALDMTFGTGGIVTTALGTDDDEISSLAID